MARLKAFQDKYAALFSISSGSQLVTSSGASLTAAAVSRSPISAYFRCNCQQACRDTLAACLVPACLASMQGMHGKARLMTAGRLQEREGVGRQ